MNYHEQHQAALRKNQQRKALNDKVEHLRSVVNSETFDSFLMGADTLVKSVSTFGAMFRSDDDDDHSEKTHVLRYSTSTGYDHSNSEHQDAFKTWLDKACEDSEVSSHKIKSFGPGHQSHEMHVTFEGMSTQENQRFLDRCNVSKQEYSFSWTCCF